MRSPRWSATAWRCRPSCRPASCCEGKTMNAYEVNFDGLVGPTHNYSGLSFG
ncbi:N-succinylarginine dihydrolase, partial [Chromobacterium amazonense]|uniref:N-succinylarginine dihydrolase n=1 Tax=Chromobacterium amazonense TaxID=1382803 RepID=UPI003B968EF2